VRRLAGAFPFGGLPPNPDLELRYACAFAVCYTFAKARSPRITAASCLEEKRRQTGALRHRKRIRSRSTVCRSLSILYSVQSWTLLQLNNQDRAPKTGRCTGTGLPRAFEERSHLDCGASATPCVQALRCCEIITNKGKGADESAHSKSGCAFEERSDVAFGGFDPFTTVPIIPVSAENVPSVRTELRVPYNTR